MQTLGASARRLLTDLMLEAVAIGAASSALAFALSPPSPPGSTA